MYLISLKSHLKEKKIEPSVCSRFAFPGFDFVRLPNLSVQFSYSQSLMIRQNASLTKRNNATHPTSKKKGEGKKKDRGRAALPGNPSMYQWWGVGGWTSLCLSSRSSEAETRGWRSARGTRMGLGPLDGFSAWRYWLAVCLKPLNHAGFTVPHL